jgi:hypothetical protein
MGRFLHGLQDQLLYRKVDAEDLTPRMEDPYNGKPYHPTCPAQIPTNVASWLDGNVREHKVVLPQALTKDPNPDSLGVL